ncbi:MAG TPA: transglycosylase SLT domain-containing protein [Salinarimonas sp.]|jgi:hypothetical protein|nr:transglycosylase SLT domain-containing protein [Salinarimonas sp.]
MNYFFGTGAGMRRSVQAAIVALGCALAPTMPAQAEHTLAMAAPVNPNEQLVFGQMRISRWLAETVVRAAEVTGVEPSLLMAMADKESSFNPSIRASTSSAEGLFQFLDGTWIEVLKRYGAKHGYAAAAEVIRPVKGRLSVAEADRTWILSLRRDPYLSALMAGEMIRSTQDTLVAGKAERTVSGTDIYLAHFLGVNGASRFLDLMDDAPEKAAPSAFPKAAKANRTLFFGTKTAEKGKAKSGPKTLAEVHQLLAQVMDKRVARYENAGRDLGTRQFASASE